MKAKLSFDDVVEFEQISEQTVRVKKSPKGFDFTLEDFGEDMDLKLGTVGDDQVLSVIEDARKNNHIGARIIAAASGTTEIQVQKDREVKFWLKVDVWDEEATNLVAPPPVITAQ